MSSLADQLLALAKHTGAPDVVEDAAILIRSLEGVRAERDILQEIVDEQRAQIAKLVERIVELTEEVSSVTEDRRHAVAALSEQVDTARAERDEARRLLKAVVDMMRDNMAHDATHPHHLCDFIHRPDIGMCKVCEDWTDAMVMCYPDDFQDEEDGK
jgi:small-conductance mechanosensitive channel